MSPTHRRSGRLRVAAAQLHGRFFDTGGDVERVCAAIKQAGERGIALLAFPETFVGGYPYWRGHVSVAREAELGASLHQSAIMAEGPESVAIAEACQLHGVGAVVGVNECDDVCGSHTTFNSLLYFHPETGYAGRHRKLIPTHTERAYWGYGAREDLRVVDFPFGRVGGLVCYEHHMLMARMALALMGEEIHCAVWPGYWETLGHIAEKRPGPASSHGEIDAIVRDYAMSTQSFVISANALVEPSEAPDEVRDVLGYNLARGGSAVVDPSGRYLAGPVLDEEMLVEAEIDLSDRILCKSYLDTVGHYARWDIFDFGLKDSVSKPDLRQSAYPPGTEENRQVVPDQPSKESPQQRIRSQADT